MTSFRLAGTILGCCLLTAATVGAEPQPVAPGPAGERAFLELAAWYDGGGRARSAHPPAAATAEAARTPASASAGPDLEALFDSLRNPEASQQRAAGDYLLTLCRQAWEDRTNGRAVPKRLPYWGGGVDSAPQRFLEVLAEQFAQQARGGEVGEVARWLWQQDHFPLGAESVAKALPRLEPADPAAFFGELLASPHPCGALATAAVAEVGRRRLAALRPRVLELCGHYRTSVRHAAQKAAGQLGAKQWATYRPEVAFSPWLVAQLERVSLMAVPPGQTWGEWSVFRYRQPVYEPPTDVTMTQPPKQIGSREASAHGWLLSSNGASFEAIDRFGAPFVLPKAETRRAPAEVSALLEDIRKARRTKGGAERLSREGGLTAQFESSQLSATEGLLAAWDFAQGRRLRAAAVLFPCLDRLADERALVGILRDHLGGELHRAMLASFSYDRDYPRTIALAQRLSAPEFDGYHYQARARELAGQLSRRSEDFQALLLPEPAAWKALRESMTRSAQIGYLAARLQLLHCVQYIQPGGLSYGDDQYAPKADAQGKPVTVINPFVELMEMTLKPGELGPLLPWLASAEYIPSYSFWRHFHPDRTLHRVGWVAAVVVNATARRQLFDPERFATLDATARQRHLEELAEWCQRHADDPPETLEQLALVEEKSWPQFRRSAWSALAEKRAGLAPVFLRRMKDFPTHREELADLIFQTREPVLETARAWLRGTNADLRMWGALILLRDGKRAEQEGLAELTEVLTNPPSQEEESEATGNAGLAPPPPKGSQDRFLRALPILLDTGDPAALALADRVLDLPQLLTGDSAGFEAVRHLLLAGRPAALHRLLAGLDSVESAGAQDGEWKGRRVTRNLSRGDELAARIHHWRTDGRSYDSFAPAPERAKQRAALKQWLEVQFTRLRAGQSAEVKPRENINVGRWEVDAP